MDNKNKNSMKLKLKIFISSFILFTIVFLGMRIDYAYLWAGLISFGAVIVDESR